MPSLSDPAFRKQTEEFSAVAELSKLWEHQPAIVDDDYPEWRFHYERALFAVVKATRENHGKETFDIRSR